MAKLSGIDSLTYVRTPSCRLLEKSGPGPIHSSDHTFGCLRRCCVKATQKLKPAAGRNYLDRNSVYRSMDRDELIKKIRGRVAQCRQLAKYVNDPRTTETLLQMANEGEADLRRLEEVDAIPPPIIDGMPHPKISQRIN
jgi:hypothetical protein